MNHDVIGLFIMIVMNAEISNHTGTTGNGKF